MTERRDCKNCNDQGRRAAEPRARNPSRQQRKALRKSGYVGRVAAGHGAELTLPDQSQPKVGKQRQVIGTEKSRELQLPMIAQLPHIIQRHECRMSLIFLSRIDRIWILHPSGGSIDGIESEIGLSPAT